MKDPYILANGILKNKLGITDQEELQQASRDIGYTKLLNIESIAQSECDVELLKEIHKHIFGDIFEWAGEFRTVPIYKEELVIPGISLEYGRPKDIGKELTQTIKEMNSFKWEGKSIDEITQKLTGFLAKIWRTHPFREGNTRTTLAFANMFAKQHGFNLDMCTMLDNIGRIEDPNTGEVKRYSIRDKFVLAALDEEHCPEPEHLEQIIKQAILNGQDKNVSSHEKSSEREEV